MFVNDETHSYLKWYWLSFTHLSAGKQTSSMIVALMCLCVSNSNSIQRFHFWTQPRIQTQKFYAASPQSFCPFIKHQQAKPFYNSALCDLCVKATEKCIIIADLFISCMNIPFYEMVLLLHQIFSKWKCILLCHWTTIPKWFAKTLGLIDALWMNLTKPAKTCLAKSNTTNTTVHCIIISF